MSLTRNGLVLLLSALALVACDEETMGIDSGSPADSGPGTDSGPGVDSGPGTDSGMDDCTITGLTIEAEQSGTADADGMFFIARSVADVPYDQVIIDLDYLGGADSAPHVFTFTGENYDTCTTCVTIQA